MKVYSQNIVTNKTNANARTGVALHHNVISDDISFKSFNSTERAVNMVVRQLTEDAKTKIQDFLPQYFDELGHSGTGLKHRISDFIFNIW